MVLLVSVVMFFVTLIWATMRDKKDIEEVLARYDLGLVHDCSTAKAALDEGQPTPRCLYVRGDCPNWANAKVSIATDHKIDDINWFPSPQPWNPVKGPIYSDWGRRCHSGEFCELWYFVPVLNKAHCQVRTLSDSKKNFFKKGSLDTFLMTVEK